MRFASYSASIAYTCIRREFFDSSFSVLSSAESTPVSSLRSCWRDHAFNITSVTSPRGRPDGESDSSIKSLQYLEITLTNVTTMVRCYGKGITSARLRHSGSPRVFCMKSCCCRRVDRHRGSHADFRCLAGLIIIASSETRFPLCSSSDPTLSPTTTHIHHHCPPIRPLHYPASILLPRE